MKKIWCAIGSLMLVVIVTISLAASGREKYYAPPTEVEIMYATEDWAYQMKDLSDVVRWRILPNGLSVTHDSSGTTMAGIDVNGNSLVGNPGDATAILSGSTGTISWSAHATTGASGWHLTEANMKQYSTFLCEMNPPGGNLGGVSEYTHQCPVGLANANALKGAGATIYMVSPTAALHGRIYTFMNITGTTPPVIYSSLGRMNGSTGTTTGQVWGTTDNQPEDLGDFHKVQCIYEPTAVSGWYVIGFGERD